MLTSPRYVGNVQVKECMKFFRRNRFEIEISMNSIKLGSENSLDFYPKKYI